MRRVTLWFLGALGACGSAPRTEKPIEPIESTAEVSHPELRAKLAAAETPEERLLAEVELGLALWEGSCPISADHSVCVEDVAPTETRPCSAPATMPVVRARTADAAEGREHLTSAMTIWEALEPRARTAETANAYAAARVALADDLTEQWLGLEVPSDGAAIDGWLKESATALNRAVEAYLAVTDEESVRTLAPERAIEAIWALADLYLDMADRVLFLPAPDGDVAAFCESLGLYATQGEEKAVWALNACVDKAAALGVTGWVPDGCRAQLHELRPDGAP